MKRNVSRTSDTQPEIFIVSHHDVDHFPVGSSARRLLEEEAKKVADDAARLQRTVLVAVVLWLVACASVRQGRPTPPRLGEALLLLFCRSDLADAVAGDLQEKFDADIRNVGLRRAKFRYWIRVVRSVGPLIFARLRNWGLFAAALEYGRRKIGL
jgi:hypothetical protein